MYEEAYNKLIEYCRNEDWQGYDPYDALSSPLSNLMFMKYMRIAWTQLLKRSPLNLRSISGIKKGENPKGHGLFVRALLLAYKKTQNEEYRRDAEELLERLWTLRSTGYKNICWGYNFPWQSRAFYVPAGTPSIVCTTFIAHAWLDHYELFKSEDSLKVALSACEFLLKDLNLMEEDDSSFCFSYTPLDRSQVHNANLLGAELLARTARLASETQFYDIALRSARFTVKRQAEDGSWPYGTAPFQSWIDSFHTGFNLVSLNSIIKDSDHKEWNDVLERGLHYYNLHFFLADGTPKYYHNRLYPIDIHSAAQAIVTFARLKHLSREAEEKIRVITDWTLKNMRDEQGFFYFQKTSSYINKTPFIRWSQAWMAYALSLAAYGD